MPARQPHDRPAPRRAATERHDRRPRRRPDARRAGEPDTRRPRREPRRPERVQRRTAAGRARPAVRLHARAGRGDLHGGQRRHARRPRRKSPEPERVHAQRPPHRGAESGRAVGANRPLAAGARRRGDRRRHRRSHLQPHCRGLVRPDLHGEPPERLDGDRHWDDSKRCVGRNDARSRRRGAHAGRRHAPHPAHAVRSDGQPAVPLQRSARHHAGPGNGFALCRDCPGHGRDGGAGLRRRAGDVRAEQRSGHRSDDRAGRVLPLVPDEHDGHRLLPSKRAGHGHKDDDPAQPSPEGLRPRRLRAAGYDAARPTR